jgi:hypothetical protein
MSIFAKVAIEILEGIFTVGCVGSFLVILLSGIEDIETVFEKELDSSAQEDAAI